MKNKNYITGSLVKDRRVVKRVELVFQACQNQAFQNPGKIVALGFKDRDGDLIFVKSLFCDKPRVSGKKLRQVILSEARQLVRDNVNFIQEGFTLASKIVDRNDLLNDPVLVPSHMDVDTMICLVRLDGKGMSGRRLVNELFNLTYQTKDVDIPSEHIEELFGVVRRLEQKGLMVKTKLGTFWYPPYFISNMAKQGIDPNEMIVEVK